MVNQRIAKAGYHGSMGAQNSTNRLREIIEIIEQNVRKLQNGARRPSTVAKGEIAACRDFCQAARAALEEGALDIAFAKILQAKHHQISAEVLQKDYETIAAQIGADLSEVRRQVLEEHRELSRRGKQRAKRA